MHKIGIIDVTTIGSTICQRHLVELAGIEGDHPEFIVHSLPYKKYHQALEGKQWQQLANLINTSIDILYRAGTTFIIIPSNTPHYAYDLFAKTAPIPVLNLIELTAEACLASGLKEVAILGTNITMKEGLYEQALAAKGIKLIIPDASVCEAIDNFIFEELIINKITKARQKTVAELIKSIACDGYILGCTELPEVYSSSNLGKPAIDTTRLLAEVAYKRAQKKL